MSQHDMNIANQGFPAFRSDLNDALQALVSTSSGATAPATTFANQLWYDTANDKLKIRDEANAAWIEILSLDQTNDRVSQFFGNSSNAVTAPSFTWGGDPNTGFYNPAADTIGVSTGGTERIRIDSSGNVGIGTSSPATKLSISTAATTDAVRWTDNTNSTGLLSTTSGASTMWATAALAFGAGAASYTERMRIDASGNVGIGTSSPTARLNIVDATSQDALRITQTGSGNALVVEDSANPDSTPFVVEAAGRAIIGHTSALSVTDISGISRTPSLQIQGLGGSLSAAYLGSWSNSDIQPSQIIFGKSKSGTVGTNGVVASGTEIGAVVFSADDGSALIPAASILAEVDGTPGSNDMPGRIVFSTTADGESSPTERMRINSSGNLLVGKTTTAETTAGACFSASVNNIGLSSGNYLIVNYVPGGSSTMIDFRTGGVSKGSISQNGSNVAYNTSSDYRLKTDVQPMTSGLTTVSALKPVTYKWKEDGSQSEGFIAHELQAVIPYAVTGEKDAVNADGSIKPQGVDYSKIVVHLVAAIQELKAEIDALKGAK